jgi:lipid II:glycine glycyltransferase (peptidoglycan interpeptide bridge formation enzyme)
MPTYLLQWEVGMRWAKKRGMTYYDMVGVPHPENLNPDDSLWGVYKFKVGFGGEISDFLGCFDLPVRPARATGWYRLEPVYYRLFQKLKHNIFY